jgi:hypothetical protein
MTASPSVLVLSLRYGTIVTVAVAAVGSVVGFVLAGVPGLVSALVGALLAAVFMALTAASMLIATRVSGGSALSGKYFGIIAGAWLIKLPAFIVIALLLRGQPWLNPYLFFGAAVIALIGTLVADGLALQRARVPYVGDIALPGDPDAVHPQERR